MVGAGVGEHSVYKTDPWGRLYRSLNSLMTQIYGSERAVAEGRRLQEVHTRHQGRRRPGPPLLRAQPGGVLLGARDRARGRAGLPGEVRPPAQRRRGRPDLRRVAPGRPDARPARAATCPPTSTGSGDAGTRSAPSSRTTRSSRTCCTTARSSPFWLPLTQRWFDALNRPAMKLQRDITTWTLDDDLRETVRPRAADAGRGAAAAPPGAVHPPARPAPPRPGPLPAADLHRPPPRDGAHRQDPPARRLSTPPPRRTMTALQEDAALPTATTERPARLGHRRGARPADRRGCSATAGDASRAAAPRRAVRRTGDRLDPDQHRRRRRPRRRDARGPVAPPGAPARTPTAPPVCCASTTCSSSARTRSST